MQIGDVLSISLNGLRAAMLAGMIGYPFIEEFLKGARLGSGVILVQIVERLAHLFLRFALGGDSRFEFPNRLAGLILAQVEIVAPHRAATLEFSFKRCRHFFLGTADYASTRLWISKRLRPPCRFGTTCSSTWFTLSALCFIRRAISSAVLPNKCIRTICST